MSAGATLNKNAPGAGSRARSSGRLRLGKPMGIRSFPTLLRALGVLVWLGISATTVLQAEWAQRLAVWAVASVSFALAFWLNASRARAAPVELLVQAVAVVVMVGLLCNGFEGFLLV